MAVVGTANHYWIDGIIACLVLAVAVYLFGSAGPIPWGRLSPLQILRARRARDEARAAAAAEVDYYGIVPERLTAEHVGEVAPVERNPEDCVTGARVAPAPPSS